MLYLSHQFAGTSTPFLLKQVELRCPDLVVALREIDGACTDESMLPRASGRQEGWPACSVVLDGALLTQDLTGAPHELSRGALLVSRDWRERKIRTLTSRAVVLSFIWKQAGRLGTSTPGGEHFARLPPPTLVLADRITKALAQSDPWLRAEQENLLGELTTHLAFYGAPMRPEGWAEVTAWKAPELEAMAGVLQSVMAPLSNRPAAVDVARILGCGERQALRRMNDYIKKMHVTVSSWRDYIFDIRMYVALLAMGNPKGKLDDVASWVGFSSATSLCHAFTTAQLPSPNEARAIMLSRCEGLYRPIAVGHAPA